MRLLGSIVLPSLLVASAAFADPEAVRDRMPPTPKHAAARSHADRRLPSDVGQLREAEAGPPGPVAVSAEPAVTPEHDVAPVETVAAASTDSDLDVELAARQMRRHARAFDACKAAALKRAPAATGTLVLALEIADRKVQSARVTDDGVHDAAFAACVTSTAQKLAFNLGAARFAWPIAIR